jgi:protein-S-isoprenylcysteine O-methyltransferase Ste14
MRFRRARPARASWNLFKTVGQIIVFWGFFLFVLPPWIAEAGRRAGVPEFPSTVGALIAVVIFSVASMLGLASAYTMAVLGQGTPLPIDSPRTLVVSGPYAYLRNPMATAGMLQGAAVALWHGSVIVFLYVVAGGLIWHLIARPLEEADLVRMFGGDFVAYRDRVPLWITRRPVPPE